MNLTTDLIGEFVQRNGEVGAEDAIFQIRGTFLDGNTLKIAMVNIRTGHTNTENFFFVKVYRSRGASPLNQTNSPYAIFGA